MVQRSGRRWSAVAAVAVSLALIPAASSAPSADVLPTLYVAYTMGCTFGITDDSGRQVTSIAPGTYQVYITTPQVFADLNLVGITDMTGCKGNVQFQLTGPGVSISTTLQDGDEDKEIQSATFQPSGTYIAVDLNQPSVARATFSTAASGAPVDPTSPVTPSTGGKGSQQTDIVGSGNASGSTPGATVVARGTIVAAVGAAGNPKLTFKGKNLTTLKAGRYTVSVVDHSMKGGLILQQTNKLGQTITGSAFVGRKSVSVVLRSGQWFFYRSFVGTKTYFLVTA